MVYTVTFNPSLDYIVTVDGFELGMTNRTASETMLPGGKGINVSIVLNNLGIDTTALGFAAGFVGKEIANMLEQAGVNARLIYLDEGNSRINVKLASIDGTEINGMGPQIPDRYIDMLMDRLGKLGGDDVLVLAGSIPGSMPSDTYQKIMKLLSENNVMVVVDATKDLLLKALEYRPFLIKPNHHELGEIFDTVITEPEEVVGYARRLRDKGAVNVLVSMGSKGGVLIAGDGKVYYAKAPDIKVVNTVGAGDSSVAGFIAGYFERNDYEYALRLSMACGVASAGSENLATLSDADAVKDDIIINIINDA